MEMYILENRLYIITLFITLIINIMSEFYVKSKILKEYKKNNDAKDAVNVLRITNQSVMVKISTLCLLASAFCTISIAMKYVEFIIALCISFVYIIIYMMVVNFMQLIIINKTFNMVRKTNYKIVDQMRPSIVNAIYVLVIFLIMVGIIYSINYVDPIISCVSLFVFIILLPYINLIISPMIFKLTFKARRFNLTITREKEIFNFVKAILKKNKIDNYRIFIWDSEDSKTANAYVAGAFKKTVFISSYLINNLSNEEIEAVIMHEAGHIVNKDLAKRVKKEMLLIIEVSLAVLCISIILALLIKDKESLDFAFFYLTAFSILIILFKSRRGKVEEHQKQEENADKYVLKKNIDKEVYISALSKIYGLNDIAEEDADIIAKVSSHPELKARINYIRNYGLNGENN